MLCKIVNKVLNDEMLRELDNSWSIQLDDDDKLVLKSCCNYLHLIRINKNSSSNKVLVEFKENCKIGEFINSVQLTSIGELYTYRPDFVIQKMYENIDRDKFKEFIKNNGCSLVYSKQKFIEFLFQKYDDKLLNIHHYFDIKPGKNDKAEFDEKVGQVYFMQNHINIYIEIMYIMYCRIFNLDESNYNQLISVKYQKIINYINNEKVENGKLCCI